VGLANFIDILASRGYRISEPLSFYFTLAVTLGWALVNVALHVGIGLFLALLLKDPLLKFKGVYRVLLIIPWAVPNYITALMWKGMFHQQFGAINGLLVALGLEPVSWFTRFSTAFAANVATNTWLGFPFMMVVALGALQSIPQELYEAAEVDGASRWTQFRRITLPLLKPAMLPAVILGSVWTFNMFNIIYLVSGGEPGGGTDILVSESFRWAFQRNQQYGFAAAYSVLIFVVLLGWSSFTRRLTRSSSEVLG
jgi:arabinogalactan oligomer/maltooligosaccharide transport system permease protein